MLLVLGMIDVVMISNLLIMVIVGSYETFVSRMELERTRTSQWLRQCQRAQDQARDGNHRHRRSICCVFIYAGQLGKEARPMPRSA